MVAQTQRRVYSPEEYLALEEAAAEKSEFRDGERVPMTGGSTTHNELAGNVYALLKVALRKQPYKVFIGDVRLWIPERRIYTYPDVMVIADGVEYYEGRQDTVLNPRVIVEVLSSSMGSYDREGKFAAYRTLPSFEEYLLLDQTRVHVEHYAKTGRKRWAFAEYDEEDGAVKFETIPFEVSLAALYKRVEIEA